MPVFTVTTPAPRNSNDVYRLRRQGRLLNGLGVEMPSFETIDWDAKPQEQTIGPSGGVEAHEQYQSSTTSAKIASGLRQFSNFLLEGSGKELLNTARDYTLAQEGRKNAESAASIARQEAAMAERLAQAEIEEAKLRQQQLQQAAIMQRTQASGGSGWIMPVAIAGGAGLLLLMIMKKK